jgi:cell division septal protein FtsQ
VEGSSRVAESTILKLADLPPGTPFSLTRLERARARLAATPELERVQIRWGYQLERRDEVLVTIAVTERPTP